ncbi:MAG TPA: Tex family protein [Bacteroidales bacterium]|nr:Tex family protein [Bacteroidales bacterium]HRX96975.1 Tex family protein [Bacteroidales bacterium]
METYFKKIAGELNIAVHQVENTVGLLNEGATVPFIARYRKEATGSLDEIQIAAIRDRMEKLKELDKRREAIINSIDEQGKLTDEMERQILAAETMTELEDLYLPYKPKRKTRATIAIAKGLEPLAKIIMSQNHDDIEYRSERFVNPKNEVNDAEEALQGACDIIAEWINENTFARSKIRGLFIRKGTIESKVAKGKEADGAKYENYFDWSERIMKSPSHRLLAMFRGENEGFLKLKIGPPEEEAIDILERQFVRSDNASGDLVYKALKDSYKRLMLPSIETEIRAMTKETADEYAIKVFTENLRQLLMAAPLGQKNILAIDPGFASGCKVVCLNRQGKLLHNENIYPHPPQNEIRQSISKIVQLVSAYKIEAIAIGNGTAGRETENMFRKIRFDRDVTVVMVNESGASVYSASPVAREEFPDYDVTVRGAVSIGRRLMDPLAELVKIDPKSIGVGQYQHDVNQTMLGKSLDDTVMSCVNAVGVELNTASKQLLAYVSGIGPSIAQNIVDYRNENGAFKTREDLKKVTRLGGKAFEQAAGFLKIRGAENPLDSSAVHPESYPIVKKMTKKLGCSVNDLMSSEELRKKIDLNEFVTESIGLPTLTDIMEELAKPGRDPREKFGFFEFDKNVRTINDLEKGMVLPGIVTNITAFGAFVDIGIKQNGLIHLSNMADRYVSDPNEFVKLNQKLQVKVVDIDHVRGRIQLSIKDVN